MVLLAIAALDVRTAAADWEELRKVDTVVVAADVRRLDLEPQMKDFDALTSLAAYRNLKLAFEDKMAAAVVRKVENSVPAVEGILAGKRGLEHNQHSLEDFDN